MDFNADLHIKKVINELCDNYGKPTKNEWGYWKFLTEKMLHNKNILDIFNYVLEISEEVSDKQWEDDYPFEIFIEEEKKIKVFGKSKSDDIIKSNLKIIDVAKKYGLVVKKNKAICPFHDDTDPSLSLNNNKNVFFCHGCQTKGDIITFIKKMEEINGNKKGC